MSHLILRSLEDSDIPILTQWLNKPHIKKWYDPIDEWIVEVRERNGDFSWLHHLMVMAGETPIGFGQYYDCFDSASMEDWNDRVFLKQGEVYSIDYLIGEESYLGHGYGKELVKQLTELVFSLGVREVIVDPDKENDKSNGVLRANGYVFDKEVGYYRLCSSDSN
ncbi:MAG: acetyltransferase [Lachnospiraceae bacterium]|jgi:RimJ/RimL family protein N-acetyltransferase|nr:acetyltransferase [Lachnospiraceae bacterium]